MNRVLCSSAIIVIVGCATGHRLADVDRLSVEEVAVRYMAAHVCNSSEYRCAVVFVRVQRDDPEASFLNQLRDLNPLAASRAEYFAEHPGDVWQRTREKSTGRRGELVEIIGIRLQTSEIVQVAVRYGVTSSVLELVKKAGQWVVASEKITGITVAQLVAAPDANRRAPESPDLYFCAAGSRR